MELYGYEVRICFNGQSAVETAGEFDPDVVLMDLGMPVMGGLEACQKMRENPAHQNILAIGQTGWGDKETRKQTDECFDHHLVKPIDINLLLDLIPPSTPACTEL